MKKINLSGKKVTVMGLGLQGQGLWAAKVAAQQGAKVTVTDLRTAKDLAPSLKKLEGLPIKYVLGKHRKEDFLNSELIIRNPAVPENSKFLKMAKGKRIPIEMEIGLFFLLAQIKSENLIGITGTRGKTTTTLLIGEILKEAGFKVVVGGNIPEKPALALLPKIKPETMIVLELSSWQLEGLAGHQISPHIAVVTNLYRDHLNRYSSMVDYFEAKKLIFAFQKPTDYLILNRDNQLTKKMADLARSRVVYFSPSQLSSSLAASVKLKGKHNLENIAAAMAAAKIMKVEPKIIQRAVKEFKGVPNRLEFIRQVNRVAYYNDTCATIPEATMAALETFDQPVVLIAGGADKRLNFSQLGRKIKASTVKAVVLLEGSATDKLERVLNQELVAGRFNDFKKAILTARKLAEPGEIVLLSPACASFGMFKNEFERGDQFKQFVNSL